MVAYTVITESFTVNRSHLMAAVFLLFTPVSITTLIGTEDARFILNGISPIAKGDLKWRDALLVTGTVNSNQSGRMHKTGNPCDCQRIIENKKISD